MTALPRVVHFRHESVPGAGRQTVYLGIVVSRGAKLLHVVLSNTTVEYVKVPLADERYMRDVELRGAPYPPARAAKVLLRRMNRARKLGVAAGHKTARNALREILKGAKPARLPEVAGNTGDGVCVSPPSPVAGGAFSGGEPS